MNRKKIVKTEPVYRWVAACDGYISVFVPPKVTKEQCEHAIETHGHSTDLRPLRVLITPAKAKKGAKK